MGEPLTFEPCCGLRASKIPETEDALEWDGMFFTLVGIHQNNDEVFQCVEDLASGKRYDVPWLTFWFSVKAGEIPFANSIEAIAIAARGRVTS